MKKHLKYCLNIKPTIVVLGLIFSILAYPLYAENENTVPQNVNDPFNKVNALIPNPPVLSSPSYILMDYASNRVIVQHQAQERKDPASLTKMMTAYVTYEALKNNKIQLQDKAKISEKAWRAPGSRMFLNVNSEASIESLLQGIIIESGNDASIALAEHIAGSEEAFAEIMNFYAKKLGMHNTHFDNATGLPSPNHYSTAEDMVKLGQALIRDFPEHYPLYAEKEFTHNQIKQENRNRLLWKHSWIDGIKTGHTEAAGYCLVASGKQKQTRFVTALMGAKNDAVRTQETEQLLQYGFNFYETHFIEPAYKTLAETRIWQGDNSTLNVGVNTDLAVSLPRGNLSPINTTLNIDKHLKAPIKEGQVVGKIMVVMNDNVLAEQPLIALENIELGNLFKRSVDTIILFFLSIWEKIKI